MVEIRHTSTRKILLRMEGSALHNRNLNGAALAGADLAGQNLIYSSLRKADLRGADLSGARLSNALLDGVNLQDANLAGCELTSASLLGARLDGANLSGAVLRYAQLTGADLRAANLAGADATMADLRGNLRDAVLTKADLRGSNFSGAMLHFADLSLADLTGANLSGAVLSGARCQGSRADCNLDDLTRSALAATPVAGMRVSNVAEARTDALSVRCPQCSFEWRIVNDHQAKSLECRVCKAPLKVDRRGLVTTHCQQPLAYGDGHAASLDKWRNCLPVRYIGGFGRDDNRLAPGHKGVVVEFFSPAGGDLWQVQFDMVGTLNVHRRALEILDPAFLRDSENLDQSEVDTMLSSAKEAVVYSTTKGTFKSLVVWHRDGRHETFDQWTQADRLIRVIKSRRIPLTKDRWYD